MRSYKTLRSVELPDRSNYRTSKFTADPRDWKIKCVCGTTCNNGWMRELEDDAEPFLTPLFSGHPIRLEPKAQELVATWAAMKAIVAEYEDPDEISTHYAHRKSLYENRRPPQEGWTVWIGYFPRQTWTPTYTLSPFLYLSAERRAKRKGPLATYYNASITTRAIGNLFLQVAHAPKKFGAENWKFPRLPNGGVLVRIWPATTFSVSWPLSPLSARDAEVARNLMRNRIAGFMRT